MRVGSGWFYFLRDCATEICLQIGLEGTLENIIHHSSLQNSRHCGRSGKLYLLQLEKTASQSQAWPCILQPAAILCLATGAFLSRFWALIMVPPLRACPAWRLISSLAEDIRPSLYSPLLLSFHADLLVPHT